MRKNHSASRSTSHRWTPLIAACLLATVPATASPAGGGGDSLTMAIRVSAGWNLLSLPVGAGGSPKDSLFPTSASSAFRFDSGYAAIDTMENGYGFWLKFDSDETITVDGAALFGDTIAVRDGWNLVGGISTTVAVDKIQSLPPGIVASNYFSFTTDSGYRSTDTLRPGSGYWVKTRGAGSLVLRSLDVPCPGVPTVEYGGKTYHTVQIAEQCWLRENLNVGQVVLSGTDQENNGVIEKYCWIDEETNCTRYGALYQWNEAMQYATLPGSRGICPPGWHIPTLGEFRELDPVTGGNSNHLKALRQGSGGGAGTNLTGFSALLSGYRHLDGTFSMLGFQTYFWTSTEREAGTVPGLYLFYYYGDYFFYDLEKGFGLNIRCLRD
jgi:uncharacterized protein (TIGR02145 family)